MFSHVWHRSDFMGQPRPSSSTQFAQEIALLSAIFRGSFKWQLFSRTICHLRGWPRRFPPFVGFEQIIRPAKIDHFTGAITARNRAWLGLGNRDKKVVTALMVQIAFAFNPGTSRRDGRGLCKYWPKNEPLLDDGDDAGWNGSDSLSNQLGGQDELRLHWEISEGLTFFKQFFLPFWNTFLIEK